MKIMVAVMATLVMLVLAGTTTGANKPLPSQCSLSPDPTVVDSTVTATATDLPVGWNVYGVIYRPDGSAFYVNTGTPHPGVFLSTPTDVETFTADLAGAWSAKYFGYDPTKPFNFRNSWKDLAMCSLTVNDQPAGAR